ncbi:MAG: VacB/RNase II family 3'-5' exoribonuclease [Duodenibacillus sp.]|nr:VacB/RNase II family 3'-5' exoribonuclease [Duodenibacillus sp.]
MSRESDPKEMDELRVFLTGSACLTIEEIDAALADLILSGAVIGDDRKGWYCSPRYALMEGVVQGARSGFRFVEDGTGYEWPISNSEFVPVFPGDRVTALAGPTDDYGRKTARIQEVESRYSTRFVCRYANAAVTDDGWTILYTVDPYGSAPVAVPKSELGAVRRTAVVVDLTGELIRTRDGRNIPAARVDRVIGRLDEADVELEVAMQRFELPHEFPQAVLDEAGSLPDKVPASEAKSRVDLRDIPFVTIDGEDARDFDDAVWCGEDGPGWRLLVAIADVSHYVTPGSALDAEAQNRATSVYFPRKVIPMLPEKLSNGLCSLNPDVDRCTLVCDMLVTAEGEVSAYQFYPALIHSHARLTYASVWTALQGEPAEIIERGADPSDILRLHALFKAFIAARKRRGAIDFETTETQFEFDPEDGHITAIKRRDHNDAHRMIEECMLAANVCAADFVARSKDGSLYRVHEPPAPERLEALRATLSAFNLRLGGGMKPSAQHYGEVLEALKGRPAYETVQMAMLRSMQQAMYSPDNIGHYGLNYPAYTHFTSPIRRYPDLLVHRTIRAILSGRRYRPEIQIDPSRLMASHAGLVVQKKLEAAARPASERGAKPNPVHEAWVRIGAISSAAERRADEASRDVMAWLKCMYAKTLTRKSYRGTITGVNPAGLYVVLDDFFIDGFVHISRIGTDYYFYDESSGVLVGEASQKRYRIGDKISVHVFSVDEAGRSIEFEASAARGKQRFSDEWF